MQAGFVDSYLRLGGAMDIQRGGGSGGGGGGGGSVAVDDSALWGYLQPCGNGVPRINFYKEILRYTIGREAGRNYVTLSALKISASHCVLTWDPKGSIVNVLDMSSNGTWLDGEKVGKGMTKELKDGAEICFGTTIPQPRNGGVEDFRYVFHSTPSTPPTHGLKAYFTLGAQLGKGAFGSVYVATHHSTGLTFAVKVLVKGGVKGIGERAAGRLREREVGTMRVLEHPGVCRLVGVFECVERISLVLEYVGGGDLLRLMQERYSSGMPETMAKDLVYQACDALAFIHSKGIIHQDLKPENILLTTDRHPIVKIADFGCSRAVDCVTMLRAQCGTPYYLAPELADAKDGCVVEEWASRVDSWSMGVIVFGMLTGKCPFVKDPLMMPRGAIRDWTIDWGTFAKVPGLYPESITFINRLLQINPETRMALVDSFEHAWLRDHVPFHKNIAVVFRRGGGNALSLQPHRNIFMSPKNEQEKGESGTLRAGPGPAVASELIEAAGAGTNAPVNANPRVGAIPIARSDSSEVFDLLLRGRSEESVGYAGSASNLGASGSVGSAGNTGSAGNAGNAGNAGRGLGVRRRSEVIAEAAESGIALPEPSEAMIANGRTRRGSLCLGVGVGRVTRAMAGRIGIGQLDVIVEEGTGLDERDAGGDAGGNGDGDGDGDVEMGSPVKIARDKTRNKTRMSRMRRRMKENGGDAMVMAMAMDVQSPTRLVAGRKGISAGTRRSSRLGGKGRKGGKGGRGL